MNQKQQDSSNMKANKVKTMRSNPDMKLVSKLNEEPMKSGEKEENKDNTSK
jgi:hypothetical protein